MYMTACEVALRRRCKTKSSKTLPPFFTLSRIVTLSRIGISGTSYLHATNYVDDVEL